MKYIILLSMISFITNTMNSMQTVKYLNNQLPIIKKSDISSNVRKFDKTSVSFNKMQTWQSETFKLDQIRLKELRNFNEKQIIELSTTSERHLIIAGGYALTMFSLMPFIRAWEEAIPNEDVKIFFIGLGLIGGCAIQGIRHVNKGKFALEKLRQIKYNTH